MITHSRRRVVGWHLELRCRAKESITLVEQAAAARCVRPGTLTLGTDNGSAFTARQFKLILSGLGIAHRRGGLPRPREPGLHRELVRQAQGALRLAARVRDPRRGQGGDRHSHRRLPPPASLGPELQNPSRGRPDLGRCPRRPTNPRGLNCQRARGAGQSLPGGSSGRLR